MEGNVAELERRYQHLLKDYQAGKFDEATFIAEVDKLQFKDEYGRYWMLGAQSGEWHYYDGQAWHQADPREAEKLPFLDSEGRYWQKGIKSGNWYYYDAQSGEWIKPGDTGPQTPVSQPGVPQQSYQPHQPQPSYAQAQPMQGYQTMPGQHDTELFQDDEGRYWAIGAKSNKWYFYDETGWHPAEEFYARTNPAGAQPGVGGYAPHSQPYPGPQDSRPTQVHPSPAQTGQVYTQQPVYPQQPPQPSGYGYPGAPQGQSPQVEPGAGQIPSPPSDVAQSGAWYYYDGKQWLQYSSGQPAEGPIPDPKSMPDKVSETAEAKPEPTKPKTEEQSEPVVAEFFEEEASDVEVVDVEVITVVDPEPDPSPAPAPKPEPEPEPETELEREPEHLSDSPRTELEDRTVVPRRSDEVRARRSRTSSTEQPNISSSGLQADVRPPRKRTPSRPVERERRAPVDSSRPVPPRKKSGPHDPTVVIPTGSTSSGISSGSPTKTVKPARPTQTERRRARANTVPMEPVSPTSEERESSRHRQVTQAMPAVTAGAAAGAAAKATSKQATQELKPPAQSKAGSAAPSSKTGPLPAPAGKPVEEKAVEEKEGYTFGDILRYFPSTLWTGVAGLAILIIAAVLIIAGVMYGSNLLGVDPVASAPTPTLDSGLAPAATPTPGPTAEAGPVNTPTPPSYALYTSPSVGTKLEYPENWEIDENADELVFSPSSEGLTFGTPRDTSMRIGKVTEADVSTPDLLEDILGEFPSDSELLNEGTISIASQSWSSSQIRFESEDFGESGIATIAATIKDDIGYFLVAAAPAAEWNITQPLFQAMINSFDFATDAEIARAQATATPTPQSTAASTDEAEDSAGGDEGDEEDDAESETATATPDATSTPTPTPTPEASPTPLVYRVQPGDTLLEIAVRFGVDMDLLALENGIDDPASLQLDQELIIPYTAEELAAYNASSGAVLPSDSDSESDDASDDASSEEEESETDDSTDTTDADEESEEESDETETTDDAPAAAAIEEEDAGSEASAEAAPVSGRIVYPAYNPNIQGYDIWLVDLATGEQTPIAGNASQPDFNQDGSLLAYRSWDLGTRGIFFRDFVGGRGGIVTRFVEDALPSWAPDGYSFTFSSRKEGDRVPRLYIGNQLGEDAYGIGFQGEYPDTFPDGRIVTRGCTPSGDCGLFIMGPRGGGVTKISGETADTAPAVSPDGSKIAFMSSGRGARNWEIWVMDADGSNPTRLTENGNNDGLPTWSPDSQNIAYVSDQGGIWAVWVMDANGNNQRKLFNMKGSPDGNVFLDEANSKGWLEERISWAP